MFIVWKETAMTVNFNSHLSITCIINIVLIIVIPKITVPKFAEGFGHFAHFPLKSAQLLGYTHVLIGLGAFEH